MSTIFAGALSLTDEIPEQLPATVTAAFPEARLFLQASPLRFEPESSWHGTPQFEPLPEQVANPAAERVRAAAARLGIDYDAEVARTLNRMKNPRSQKAPGPGDNHAGADPLKDVSTYDHELAQALLKDQLRVLHGIT